MMGLPRNGYHSRMGKRVTYWPARAMNVVWGLPQTVVGAALFCALRGWRRCHAFRSAIVTEWRLRAGLSLGMFVFVPRGASRDLVLHEYGHTLQSLFLGPLYLPVIVVPSLVWAGLPRLERYRLRKGYSYYRFFTERWANRLVHRLTGEKSIGWYDHVPRRQRARRS
ncbi:MAG: hypothetical protein J6D34_03135 [Atopobiaceae bacterium]|nr:hypothetical protein [Atopobiaceae bacterium]